ncbi:MAG: hypothetical protein AB1646_18880 [Thermodesulfobacteriota bacterium]
MESPGQSQVHRPDFGRGCLAATCLVVKGLVYVAMVLAVAVGPWGCGGRIATNGCAVVTGVACDGSMRLQYKDGKTAVKRLECDNLAKDLKTVGKNQFQPARFVETRKGSTLTFPDGQTIHYKDVKKDCPAE